ncbi:MAG: glycosyltransferase [Solirubrobacteraceae bacterium]
MTGRSVAVFIAAAIAEIGGAYLVCHRRELRRVVARGVASFAERADAVVSLAAHCRREPWPLLETVRPRILIERDPGYTHLWAADGDPLEIFGEHDIHFTVGANVGTSRSPIPTCGIEWHPLWPPVIHDWWCAPAEPERNRFTTVSAWRGYGYLELDGRTFGPKVEEFTKFIDLPRVSGEQLELTLAIAPDDPDRDLLQTHGWRLEQPSVVSTPGRYRGYVAGSLGEFSCAKGGYVGTRSGWFSDRSACYLAAGRPVVLQSTGFEDVMPVGEGVFAVRDVDGAAAAMAEIRGDYARHARAARELAREFFDAERLLASMLDQSGLPPRSPA